MSIQMFRRFFVVLFVAVAVAGCSWLGPSDSAGPSSASAVRSDDCRWDRSRCIYEGSYEPGESDYAEEEARRLNQETIQRLRRGAWR